MNKLKEFLKKKKANKKLVYNICLIVTILGLLFIVSGTSYALLTGSSSSDKEQIIRAGDVTLELSEYFENTSQPISVISDTDGLLQEETYSFKLKNIGEVSARYDIKLVNEVPSSYSDGVIDDKYVKVGVEINGEEHGPFTLEEANNILDSGIIYENELISYEIRVWLNEDYEEELLEMEGYKGFFKVQVEAEQSLQEKLPTAAEIIINKVGTDGIVAEEHPETEQLEATTDYRYTGANPNNYVSFNNELWRIIGVFPTDDGTGNIENRIKIIRDESIGDIAWDESNINDWSTSSLQQLLNSGDYYNRTGNYASNGLTSEAKRMISDTKWYLGGSSSYNDVTTGMFYERERGTIVYSVRPTSFIGEVGLMYPSDYGYATSGGSTTSREECLAKELFNWDSSSYSDCKNNDWLLYSSTQWTMAPNSGDSSIVFIVYSAGYVSYHSAYVTYAVRPVLALASTVGVTGGTGTESDPYILEI